MSGEQREFIRVAVNFKGFLRRLTYPDEVQLFTEGPASAMDAMGFDMKSANFSEPILRALTALNAKLDLLLSLQGQQNLLADFPIRSDIFEMSGAGVRLMCEQDFEPGDHVELVIVLMHTPLRMAGAIATVIREESFHGRRAYALDFTRIRERDLEFIVQAVMQAERDGMHGHKWD